MSIVIRNGAPGVPAHENLLTRGEVDLILTFLASRE
jgi:hypothetical protein